MLQIFEVHCMRTGSCMAPDVLTSPRRTLQLLPIASWPPPAKVEESAEKTLSRELGVT